MADAISWASGDPYEAFMGRWSRLVAPEFVRWLDATPGLRWIDVGCGSGALSEAVLELASPAAVLGIDSSPGFVDFAREHVTSPVATFEIGDALDLPDGGFDRAVSGLVLNFVPDPAAAAAELRRAVVPGGVAAAYVWDYPGEMWFLRHFWDAAELLDPAARELHQSRRFGYCTAEWLPGLFTTAGFAAVEGRGIDIPTRFAGFDDYWLPFLGGQGTAPSYLASLGEGARDELRELLRERLPFEPDATLQLAARAWAVRGIA